MAFAFLNRLSSMSPGGASSPPVAIDFGTSALKLLQITGSDPPALVACAAVDTPEDLLGKPAERLAFQLEALPGLARGAGFTTKRAVCALPAGQTFCKHMQFQKDPTVPLGELVKATVPLQLGCDPWSLVFRHVEVGEVGRPSGSGAAVGGGGGGARSTEVICFAVARELVDRFMQAIKAAKLVPVGMHSEYLATLRAFDPVTRRAEDSALTTLYMDLGVAATKVMIAHGRNLVFARGIDLGGLRLDETVAQQLGRPLGGGRAARLGMAQMRPAKTAEPARAEAGGGSAGSAMPALAAAMAKEGAGGATDGGGAGEAGVAVLDERRVRPTPPGFTPDVETQPAVKVAPPGADLSEPLELLTDEIAMCLRYHQSLFPDRRVDRAIFVGGEARHRGLCQHIARTLRISAQIADPMARVARTGSEPATGVDLKCAQPGWTVALGLCLSPTDL